MTSGANPIRIFNTLLRSRFLIAHEITEVYKPAITRNKDKLIELIKEKTELARKSEIAKKIEVAKGFYTLEMAPPGSNDMQVRMHKILQESHKLNADLALLKDFFKHKCYKHITVKQAWLLILVGTEVGLWFFLGETIGKLHIVGYSV